MADLPFEPGSIELAGRLLRSLDVEGKIPRAIEALGPVGGREVILLGGGHARARQLEELGARVTVVESSAALIEQPDASADIVVTYWSGFREDPGSGLVSGSSVASASGDASGSGLASGSGPGDGRSGQLRHAERVLRHGGRLLVVHDYGRDEVSTLRGDLPEYRTWSRRDGWFLRNGFRIRVVHAFWTFDTMDELASFVAGSFGSPGSALVASLTRPRLRYNVAVYHRTRGGP